MSTLKILLSIVCMLLAYGCAHGQGCTGGFAGGYSYSQPAYAPPTTYAVPTVGEQSTFGVPFQSPCYYPPGAQAQQSVRPGAVEIDFDGPGGAPPAVYSAAAPTLEVASRQPGSCRVVRYHGQLWYLCPYRRY